jgi:hypothetical protein
MSGLVLDIFYCKDESKWYHLGINIFPLSKQISWKLPIISMEGSACMGRAAEARFN